MLHLLGSLCAARVVRLAPAWLAGEAGEPVRLRLLQLTSVLLLCTLSGRAGRVSTSTLSGPTGWDDSSRTLRLASDGNARASLLRVNPTEAALLRLRWLTLG